MTKLLISGTRHATIADHGLIIKRAILDALFNPDSTTGGVDEIYVGDAAGVDLIALQIAKRAGWTLHEFEARWDECDPQCPTGNANRPHRLKYRHGRGDYCPRAGMRRNQQMVDAFTAVGGRLVLTFPAAGLVERDVRNCIRLARQAVLQVTEHPLTTKETSRG